MRLSNAFVYGGLVFVALTCFGFSWFWSLGYAVLGSAALLFFMYRAQASAWNKGVCKPCITRWAVSDGWTGGTGYRCGCGHHRLELTDRFDIPGRNS